MIAFLYEEIITEPYLFGIIAVFSFLVIMLLVFYKMFTKYLEFKKTQTSTK